MANLTNNGSSSNWALTVNPSTSSQTLTLPTKGLYIDRDFVITVGSVTAGVGTATCTISGGGLSKGTASGGGLTQGTASGGGLTQGTASGGAVSSSTTDIVGTNVGVDTSDTYGCGIKVVASSSASRTAFSQTVTRAAFSQTVNLAAFSQTVSRAAITDTHTAGYLAAQSETTKIAADSATVSLSANSSTVTLASGSSTVSLAAGSATSSRTEYVNSLTIPAAKTFGSSSAKGAITLSAGTSASAPTSAYLTMNTNSILYITDAVTGKTWKVSCDSANNALTVEQ